MRWRDGCCCRRKYLAGPSSLGFLIGALLLGIKTERRGLAFCYSGRVPKVSGQRRPEFWDIGGNPGIVLWQRRQAVCDIVMVRAVEFVRRRIVRTVAPQCPQHRARNKKQSQGGATGKDFAREPRDLRALCTQTQGLRAVSRTLLFG